MHPLFHLAPLALAASLANSPALAQPSAANSPQIFQAGGAAALDIQLAVDTWRSHLGQRNVGPGAFDGGRREINWDAAPDAAADPVFMPGNAFNAATGGRANGIGFFTEGQGFKQGADSSNPTGTAPNFGFTEFTPFSQERSFAVIGSTDMTVRFFVPGSTDTPAWVRGFGAVFLGVDSADSFIEFLGRDGKVLEKVSVPQGAFAFAGFASGQDDPWIASVRIHAGNAAIGSVSGNRADFVAMDDFIYGEPTAVTAVPEPGTWAMALAGLSFVGAVARRRRAA